MARKEFGNYRLSKETIEMLSDMKLAFEVCYMKHITNDGLIQKLAACVEGADPDVFKTFSEIISKKNNSNC